MTSLVRMLAALWLGLALFTAGCGGEKEEKVDLAAQLSGLAGDADAKIAALAEISKLGDKAASAVGKITPLLKDEDAVVRRTAAFTLGAMGPAAKAAVPELKGMLETTDRDQMTAVANALRAIDPTSLPGFKMDNTAPAESASE